MTETPEQRARRLGLVKETPEERAQRLGLVPARPTIELDVQQRSESTRALPHNRANRADDVAAGGIAEGTIPAALGIIASGAQAIPGMERLQAGVRSVARGQPYDEALKDMRGVTDDIPLPIKLAAQVPAMAAGAGAMGKVAALRSPAAGGAAIGAADQLLDADDQTLESRLGHTAAGGLGGAVVGKSLDALVMGGRAGMSATPGTNAGNRMRAMKAADKTNYSIATKEGSAATIPHSIGPAVTPEQQAVRDILERPDIRPFAASVRSNAKYANANDAEILQAVFRRMSKQQTGLQQRMKVNGWDAESADAADAIGLAKQELLTAADAVMPSFRKAVQAHAEKASEIDAVGLGSKAARRLAGAPATGKRIATESEEAYADAIKRLAPNERDAAIEGVVGGLKERIRPNANPISGFGAFAAIKRPARVASFLREVGDKKQVLLDDLVRAGFIGASPLVP
jgi:hypothetical protein